MFRSVLVAVDGSDAAAKALEEAIDLARAEGARLTLISVAAPPRWVFAGGPIVVPLPVDEVLERDAQAVVERAKALVPEDIPVSTVVRRGPAAEAILKRVETGEHDLVVMGSRGLGPAGALILGSVSRSVLSHSPVPVLIARAGPTLVHPATEKGNDVIEKILYTAEATAEGGRDGHARTSDGRLDVELDVPTEMGGSGGRGTNPEQLFAVGYAACFQSALLRIAAQQKHDLTGSKITARVGIGPEHEGGFGLAVALDLDAPELDHETAATLMERAHEVCPYSRATRGNVDVTLTVQRGSIERAAAA
jgi:lipoyl-dependent peroxiredoxin